MSRTRLAIDGITYKKIQSDLVGVLSAYEVFDEGRSIGFVWSRCGFSYRGTMGNRLATEVVAR